MKKHNLPPFTEALLAMTCGERSDFDTPGHHSGDFFRLTPEGKTFYKILGRGAFAADISDSSSAIGDPSSHEGVSGAAEALAARVWGSDRCFFVLAGTSTSNRIAASALLAEGDLVLFDRNSHKSTYQGALTEAGALPVYLETDRNDRGVIGGLTERALDESELRRKAAALSPAAAGKKHPFRTACLELATYDGLFLNAEEIIRRLAPLCDYILFDAAWAGYENFLPVLSHCAPLKLSLTKDAPGLLVTQSVHKQLAGFSQTSQLHKKDAHLKGQAQYLDDDVLQDSFLSHISTSPYYPLFAGLEMNAAIHQRCGKELWARAEKNAVRLKKEILKTCHLFRPFLPPAVNGRTWEAYPAGGITGKSDFYALSSTDRWHGFHREAAGLYQLDPCKTLLTTGSMEGKAAGFPAPLLSAYLEAHRVTPEKCDFYSLLFLNEPGDTRRKSKVLVKWLRKAEAAYEADLPLDDFLPGLPHEEGEGVRRFSVRYHRFLLAHGASAKEQALFSEDHFPRMALSPRAAHEAFVRGRRKAVPLTEALGRVSLEHILPYPPGIVVLAAGEVWTKEVLDYFLFLEAYGQKFPAFAPEMVGVHRDGRGVPYVWVLEE